MKQQWRRDGAGHKERAVDRLAVDAQAQLRRADGHLVDIRLKNVSQEGFRCDCLEPLEIGSDATLVLPDTGEFPVRIVWQLGLGAGAQFVPALSWRRLFAMLLAASRARDAA
jgi:hypothetical protein